MKNIEQWNINRFNECRDLTARVYKMNTSTISSEDNNSDSNTMEDEKVCLECQGFSLFYGENQALFNINLEIR